MAKEVSPWPDPKEESQVHQEKIREYQQAIAEAEDPRPICFEFIGYIRERTSALTDKYNALLREYNKRNTEPPSVNLKIEEPYQDGKNGEWIHYPGMYRVKLQELARMLQEELDDLGGPEFDTDIDLAMYKALSVAHEALHMSAEKGRFEFYPKHTAKGEEE